MWNTYGSGMAGVTCCVPCRQISTACTCACGAPSGRRYRCRAPFSASWSNRSNPSRASRSAPMMSARSEVMQRLKLAVCLNSLGLPLRQGLQQVERMGVTGVQFDASGDLSPRSLSQTGRRELLHLLRAHNLEIAGLGCPLRHGLDVAEGQDARIDAVKRVMSLRFDLGARRVTIQAGRAPEETDSPRARLMTEAFLALGHHGDRTGTMLALETG